ncbi:MAG: DUF4286 family protein [Flavobacteriales bacterium]|nr:DUF4286 family protein [Flavobacteriales bacterium]
MIIYNVTISIDPSEHENWLEWMRNYHIPNVMQTGCFTHYKICKILSTQPDETGITYAIQYTCNSINELNQYQEKFAGSLQKEHSEKYRGKFAAFRTILEIID